ncbi:Uncharacterised protein [Mycobacteroides abscessus subsp. abscessus]|nr:Uncharacterised protein [Mycobacteroides abscessus subsp. abscessus]SII61046.1 Uncharacterised protein [Mycobacteroides abscessus subsp. abscessus]SIJ52002.1 Uncharacterised protein [Mycobacteroides abscessus subsp. abscessus]SIJ63102.1 Uncharacterised protein [Mycobacteroides abscessus subsp. abscessus]SIL73646.1 Uncharacterised protein [Mycobacteroides abscessus subsp. abscessus]
MIVNASGERRYGADKRTVALNGQLSDHSRESLYALLDVCYSCGHAWVPRRSVTSLGALRWLTEAMCRGMRDQLNS